MVVTQRGLYVRELVGGPSRVAHFDYDGRPRGLLPSPEVAAIGQVVPLNDGTILYSVSTYLRPTYFSRFDEATSELSKLAQTSPVKFDDAEVVRTFATFYAHGGLHVYGVTIGQFGDFLQHRFFVASGRGAEL